MGFHGFYFHHAVGLVTGIAEGGFGEVGIATVDADFDDSIGAVEGFHLVRIHDVVHCDFSVHSFNLLVL